MPGLIPWLLLLVSINLALFLSTVLQEPAFQLEYLRQFLVPSLVALALPLTFTKCRDLRAMSYAMAFGLLLIIVLNLAQYWREFTTLGRIPEEISPHRRYGDGLIVVIPFALWVALTARSAWVRGGCYVALSIGVVMLILTGMRGGWLAFGVSSLFIAVAAYRVFGGKRMIAVSVLLAATIGAVMYMAPENFTINRIDRGFSTTHRVDGTWLPAVDMVAERPLAGFGFGERVFHHNFYERKPDHPEWSLRRSEGPHNTYLSLAFAAGVPTLLAYLALLTGVIYQITRGAAWALRDSDEATREHGALGVMIVAALIAAYGVHGMVETKTWAPFGVLMGMAFAWLRVTASEVSATARITE
ncbi:MAG: O-antigen ligase family protein [Gammaproteobacteria bacterium]|nr:O-antigen ligase family protein [Gammaproteobacteria bacterium]